ncbi:MAG: hypothetical protein J6X66_06645 [Lachnospiraceae bacterium]|nr:hypothetical protein [Lachnospiraceae bacterium]
MQHQSDLGRSGLVDIRKMKEGTDMDKGILADYNEFLKNNRIKVNRYLNIVLWFFVITGPAIAAGIKAGFFPDVSYATCYNISIGLIVLSLIHLLLLKNFPGSLVTCLYALTSLDALIVYMSYSHVNINFP